MIFDPNYAAEILPDLLAATLVTCQATISGFALALAGGLALAMLRMSSVWLFSRVADWYIQAVRSTPFLIQLFFLFYVLPKYGIRFDALTTGIIALGAHFSSYTAEVFRAGIEGVVRGQWDAALALNLSARHTWLRIILPQAIPPILPPLGNYLVGMFKDSAILSTISVTELLGTALSAASRSFRYTESLMLVGAIFLVLALAGSSLIRMGEARLARRFA